MEDSANVNYPVALREYLELIEKVAAAQEQVKHLAADIARDSERLQRLRKLLEKSVDPACGSATQPVIRTYTNGRYQTVSVFWDHGLQRGRIAVTKNEDGR